MVDESPVNHLEQTAFNNAPADYYYEEPYRNRGQPYPVQANKHSPHSKAHINEVHDSSNNHNNESTHSQRILVTTTSTTKGPPGAEGNNFHVHHSRRKIDKLNVEPNLKEVLIDSDDDGHNASPRGAILSLSLGLCLTAFMILIVGCRMKMVRRRMRRGGKSSYAHDADYLVNGMYL